MTALGPAEFDVAWFASVRGRRVEWTPDDVYKLYSQQATRRMYPRALDLASIGALALQGGWYGAMAVRDDGCGRLTDDITGSFHNARVRSAYPT
jgi:hypothetical protein